MQLQLTLVREFPQTGPSSQNMYPVVSQTKRVSFDFACKAASQGMPFEMLKYARKNEKHPQVFLLIKGFLLPVA